MIGTHSHLSRSLLSAAGAIVALDGIISVERATVAGAVDSELRDAAERALWLFAVDEAHVGECFEAVRFQREK